MVSAHQRSDHDRYQSGATHYNEIEVLTDKSSFERDQILMLS